LSLLAASAAQSAKTAETTRSVLEIPNANASSQEDMKPYVELIEHTDAQIPMTPVRGGVFLMGSLSGEADRRDDEGPQHQVKIDPFWMSTYEITWDAFEVWMFDLDIQRRKLKKLAPNARDIAADEHQLSQPTEPYEDMTFGMGKNGCPAVCLTQLAARVFCEWLTAKTGRYYRLPSEAEWEYACRAGATTAYYFGDDASKLGDYAWYFDNADEKYHKVGQKKPNPWGLYDMHGNVAEWVLDQHDTTFYGKQAGGAADNPLNTPVQMDPRVVRGGSWDDDPAALRCAARCQSTPKWKARDPQIPQSIWYYTDAPHVGFRIVRPLVEPSEAEKKEKWDKSLPVEDRKQGR
jgi:formylglycine-generating enzyme required for sulfatase activity